MEEVHTSDMILDRFIMDSYKAGGSWGGLASAGWLTRCDITGAYKLTDKAINFNNGKEQ
jgi:hypothetical protein